MEKAIIIADDDEMNRSILRELFKKDYDILEAADGQQVLTLLEKEKSRILIILLDIIMPRMTGIDVLKVMAEKKYLNSIPVILITGSTSKENEKISYEIGVSDIITKPYDSYIVKRRVENVLSLYRHKHNLEQMVKEQTLKIQEQAERLKKTNDFVIDTLSTVVEFRDLESGAHIFRIRNFTRILLKKAEEKGLFKCDSAETEEKIINASAMHDIGKIATPDYILLKPGKLTPEEFEIMKNHTLQGCSILSRLHYINDAEFYKYCYDICRFHHERHDGSGYPDHLKGDEIPFWAQIVAIADVYDALVSERVYKKAFSHEEAVRMINGGECGVFSSTLLQSFNEVKDILHEYENATERLESVFS